MNRWKIRPLIWLKRQPEQRVMMILAVVVGLGSGAAAVVLKTLIELIGKLLTGWFDASWDNFLLLLYPGAGMLLSLLFVRYVVRDDIGHGVTKVLLAAQHVDFHALEFRDHRFRRLGRSGGSHRVHRCGDRLQCGPLAGTFLQEHDHPPVLRCSRGCGRYLQGSDAGT